MDSKYSELSLLTELLLQRWRLQLQLCTGQSCCWQLQGGWRGKTLTCTFGVIMMSFFKTFSLIQMYVLLSVKSVCFLFVSQIFLLIQNDKNKSDYVYLSWLARCCMFSFSLNDVNICWYITVWLFYCCQWTLLSYLDIMNQKARLAWELYMKMETSAESFSLLQLIANDCYKVTLLY